MTNLAESPTLPQAAARRSRRISIIWIVPVVAVVIGAWLAWDTLFKEGPTIKISFDSGEGLQAGQSKLVGLCIMLITIQTGRTGWLRYRTRLYQIVRFVGRWSMIDIFMESLLGALVAFGSVITIEPGAGALAFCAVVILTMFAAETFDPRLMWDAATRREPAAISDNPRLAVGN